MNHAQNATSAALRHELRDANSNTGIGANHISGQTGKSPVPKYTSTAVVAVATRALTRPLLLVANATDIPSERAPVKPAKTRGGHSHPSAEKEHGHAVRKRPGFKDD